MKHNDAFRGQVRKRQLSAWFSFIFSLSFNLWVLLGPVTMLGGIRATERAMGPESATTASVDLQVTPGRPYIMV